MPKTSEPPQADIYRDALEQLCCYVTNGDRRYESRNPYGVPAIKQALQVLAGEKDYLDALNGVEPRYNDL